MKVKDAIEAADRLLENEIYLGDKIRWLNALDHQIAEELLYTHEGSGYDPKDSPWTPHTENGYAAEDLLVSDYYADLYVDYLIMQYSQYQRETEAQNAEAAAFQAKYAAYAMWFNRTHMPKAGPNLMF